MKLVFATNNVNKLIEIKHLLTGNVQLLSLRDIGLKEDMPEDQDTIEKNAIQKASYINKKYNINCFADDTGLEVEVLNGRPGVKSARYAGESKSSDKNIEKLLFELKNKQNRNARFKTVICLIIEGKQYIFEGIAKGKIIDRKKGNKGFGYDPVFVPEGYSKTFAEMALAEKNKISHRAIAIKKFTEFINLKLPQVG